MLQEIALRGTSARVGDLSAQLAGAPSARVPSGTWVPQRAPEDHRVADAVADLQPRSRYVFDSSTFHLMPVGGASSRDFCHRVSLHCWLLEW